MNFNALRDSCSESHFRDPGGESDGDRRKGSRSTTSSTSWRKVAKLAIANVESISLFIILIQNIDIKCLKST